MCVWEGGRAEGAPLRGLVLGDLLLTPRPELVAIDVMEAAVLVPLRMILLNPRQRS